VRYLPIAVDVAGRSAVVIGATLETVSKIARLLDAGARVTVFATGAVHPDVLAREAEGTLRIERREPSADDLGAATIVFVAPEEEARGQALMAWARGEQRLLCTIDRPEACTFVNPAVAQGPGIEVAVSTGGVSPATARRLREDLEAALADPLLARYLEALAALRASLPRAERAARMKAAAAGFALEARFTFPAWVALGAPPEDE
jgi:precorrin-2 dehydrogenase / sirohydrochlorin ferrochelatase